ncbi:acetate--CoA ligase [Endozoicomonas arenosclerae]|uniref:acetate--CoA ligase n=1 Tax=Endozoicomonas arenosclerae TaxID=1633495 RepID=UPI0007862741|nr:acetate--CoA ligase [Endozoicomonas arenosclerae]
MTEARVYPVTEAQRQNTLVDNERYLEMYQQSVVNPERFWREHGNRIDWFTPYTQIKKVSFDHENVDINWFFDGTTNASYNCLDRHLETKGDQIAIIWEPDEEDQPAQKFTYRDLHEKVCRLANGLKSQGIGKGDVVAIYMPMVVEATVAMLACSRIGAIHSVVFGGFSPEALAGRIIDSNAKLVLTADEGIRGGRKVALKKNVDQALENKEVTSIEKVIVLRHTGAEIFWQDGRDIDWHELTAMTSPSCTPEAMNAEDPLFILYTSGSTGKPKGVLHTTGGYLVYASMTHQYVFDYKDGEVFWCNADIGWITGHTYVTYGPLLNGATMVMHEGVPNYPASNRVSKVVDKHQVNILYTAPTAIRALMAEGDAAIEGTDRSSLRLLGSVGEPINPEAWSWYYKTIGNEECPIVDTWWQTETGGAMLTPLPGATDLKPGSATRPFFGIKPALVDNEGRILEGKQEGNLVILDSWPGQARTVFGDHERFVQTYFSSFKGMYTTGDGARRDEDGYYWITGRVDDVLNVSGHRMGTAEIESALVSHHDVAEAAVVGFPHDIKGQGIYVYVTLTAESEYSDELKNELRQWVRKEIGPIASPDIIQWAPGLPKTRSGKIMRRILRKIASGEYENLGDTSTLADPSVVESLIKDRALAS